MRYWASVQLKEIDQSSHKRGNADQHVTRRVDEGVEFQYPGSAQIRCACETGCRHLQPARASASARASSLAPTPGTVIQVVLQLSARNIAPVSERRCDVLNLLFWDIQNRSLPETRHLF